MVSEQEILTSVQSCLTWVERVMLTPDRGKKGVYERVRTDKNEIVRLCRPDIASEYLHLLWEYADLTGDHTYDDVFTNVKNWLLSAQNDRGYFPFYLTGGEKNFPSKLTYQNDNGKVLLNLVYLYKKTGDEALLAAAKKCADYFVKIQKRKGNFYSLALRLKKKSSFGPCFLLWPGAGLVYLGKLTGEKKYLRAGYKAFSCVKTENGRIKTTYEICRDEAWRPVSSENFIALFCYCLAYKATGDELFLKNIAALYPFCHSLLDKDTGAIKNGAPGLFASLNDNEAITDFVYTQGYGSNALLSLATLPKYQEAFTQAEKVIPFLLKTQCREGDEKVDGGWRGSYEIATGKPKGRCDQKNSLDEGGEFSVYTGWCAFPLCISLLCYLKQRRKATKDKVTCYACKDDKESAILTI